MSTRASRRAKRIKKRAKRHGEQGVCFYCRVSMCRSGDDPATIEHLISKSRGGDNSIENLRLAHRSCNMAVASLPVSVKLRLAGSMKRGVLPDWAKAEYEEPPWLRKLIAQANRDPSWARVIASDDAKLDTWIEKAAERSGMSSTHAAVSDT